MLVRVVNFPLRVVSGSLAAMFFRKMFLHIFFYEFDLSKWDKQVSSSGH